MQEQPPTAAPMSNLRSTSAMHPAAVRIRSPRQPTTGKQPKHPGQMPVRHSPPVLHLLLAVEIISAESSYEVKFKLTDAFTSIEVTDTLSTASVVMDFKSGGLGVAVGKVAETDQCFEVSDAWDVKVYGMLLEAYIKAKSPASAGIAYATCSTASATAAKVAVCTGFKLTTGATVLVKFSNTNSAASQP